MLAPGPVSSKMDGFKTAFISTPLVLMPREKQELDPSIPKRSKVVEDSLDQCIVGGEINVPFWQGLLKTGDVFAQMVKIINGWKKGRLGDREITVMNSTGLSAVDAVCYYGAYEKICRL